MSHPSSRSHIARTSVSRLEEDIVDFATDENSSRIPVMKAMKSSEQLAQGPPLDQATNEIKGLISALVKLRDADIAFAKNGIESIVNYCNGAHQVHANNLEALGHRLRFKGFIDLFNLSIEMKTNCYNMIVCG